MWVAADSSSLIAYMNNEQGTDTRRVSEAMDANRLMVPSVVVTELLSGPAVTDAMIADFLTIPQLPLTEGYWERVGHLRACILRQKLKARLGDALIAQSCIDHHVPLITRDTDFRHYVPHGLELAA
jgi:predicted nucleic acid-binding protein